MSELVLEITQGAEDPYRVALIPFNGEKNISETLNDVIKNDLFRSGEFNIYGIDSLLSIPKNEDEIVFNDFKILNLSLIHI